MRFRFSVALLLSFAPACSQHDTPPPPDVAEVLQYPTFEIFRSSRWFDGVSGDLAVVDLAKLAQESVVTAESLTEVASETEMLMGVDQDGRPSAELQPRLPPSARRIYLLLPEVMSTLEPLWSSEKWSATDVEQARNAVTFIARIAGAPKPVFALGKHAKNRAGLEALVRWFQATSARPECLAAMILTTDDGPYVGLPYETGVILPAEGSIALGDVAELHLGHTELAPEAWVLQCVRGNKLLWSRVISGLPDGAVSHAEFYGDAQAENLGNYGWHVPFIVDWPAGQEPAHLYLDAEGKLLFYFLSW